MTDPFKNNLPENRSGDGVDQTDVIPVLLYVRDPAPADPTRPLVPLKLGELGGGGAASTSSNTEVTATYAPQVLTVGAQETQLTVPAGANRALVRVTAGASRMGYGNAATAGVESSALLAGAQLAALRLIRFGAEDATVRADFWREE